MTHRAQEGGGGPIGAAHLKAHAQIVRVSIQSSGEPCYQAILDQSCGKPTIAAANIGEADHEWRPRKHRAYGRGEKRRTGAIRTV
jgi:hypothetical protein